ncbi:MAG: hypothetical protein PHX25_01260 [Candidatus Pacebacteria bacterium]|nr:hypothetical protein [Candidatus Paceibacterota bacterium]
MKKRIILLVLLGLFSFSSAMASTLVVEQITQPLSGVAPEGATRIPFSKVRFRAQNGKVALYGLYVEKTGTAGQVFSGVALLRNGVQMGMTVTSFGADNRVMLMADSPFEIADGSSYDLTVVGNMHDDLSENHDETIGIAIVGVHTSATVQGFVRIDGTHRRVSAEYVIGTVEVTASVDNPPAGATVFPGETKIFSSVNLIASSVEDEILKSVIVKMTGTATKSDYNGVTLTVGTTSYPMTVLPDGRYYAGGINKTVTNIASTKVSVSANVIGGVGKTISFDIVESTDVELVGTVTGFGTTPIGSGSSFGSFPWFKGTTTNIVQAPQPPPPLPPPTAKQRKAGAMTAIRSLLLHK